MNKKTRQIIMFGFIIAFFIIAPTLIFYASGYRFDLKRKTIIKTGTLMVEAKNIKNAQLYINNKLYANDFNEKTFVYNLLPADYEVKLTKEGYHDWQKKLTINSSLTTFAKDIVLFKNQPAEQIIDGNIINFYLSPDKEKTIYLLEDESFWELYYFNLSDSQKQLVTRLPKQETALTVNWSNSSKKILLQYDQNFSIYDIKNIKNVINVNEIITDPESIKWSGSNDNQIFAKSKSVIFQIDLSNNKSERIIDLTKLFPQTDENNELVLNKEFFIEGADIFYIIRFNNHDTLYKYNLTFSTNKKIAGLNKSTNYKFIASSNNYLTLIDQDFEKLYLIKKVINDAEANLSQEAIWEFNANNASWDSGEKQIVIYNDFEIYTYNTETNQKNFIDRYGQQIKKIDWFSDYSYLFVLFDNQIKIIDLIQTNNMRNVIEISKAESITNFYLDKKIETIFFNNQSGESQGVFTQAIK